MTTPPAHTPLPEPGALTPVEWSTRLAAYTGRGRDAYDPAIVTCREALAYWRVRRAIDADAGHIGSTAVTALIAVLRNAGKAVGA